MGQRGLCKNRGFYFLLWERKRKSLIGNRFIVNHRRVSAVKRAQFFFSDRMTYIVLRGHRCNIIVLIVHEPSEEKNSDDSKYSFMMN